jgi:hypothetical protein
VPCRGLLDPLAEKPQAEVELFLAVRLLFDAVGTREGLRKEAPADRLDECCREGARGQRTDVVAQTPRPVPRLDEPFDGRIRESERSRDVVGRADRKDRGRPHSSRCELLEDAPHRAVAAGCDDELGPLVECRLPAGLLHRAVDHLVVAGGDGLPERALAVILVAGGGVVQQRHAHGWNPDRVGTTARRSPCAS